MKTYKQFIFESEEARRDLYELAPAAALGLGMGAWAAYDGIKSTMKAIKNPNEKNITNAAIDTLGVIPYVKPLKYVRGARIIQGAGASAETAGWARDINNSLGYLKNLGTDVKTHGPALGRRWNDFLNKDGDGLLDTKKYQAQANQERIKKAQEQEAERVKKQDETPGIEPTVTILQQPQKDGSVKRTDVTDTTPPPSPEKKKRNGSNMTNWDRFVPPGMVMPGGRK